MNEDKILQFASRPPTATLAGGALSFLPEGMGEPRRTAGGGLFGSLQSALKRTGPFYVAVRALIKPVLVNPAYRRRCRDLLRSYDDSAVILHLGSGPNRLQGRAEIINLDLFGFPGVDMVADAHQLPIRNDSVDLVVSLSVIEHVSHPQQVVDEVFRILRPGGQVGLYAPFLAPFHAAPDDFSRWTGPGLTKLLNKFVDHETIVGGGPTSALLWVFQEWLATVLSCGYRPLRDLLFSLLLVTTFPLKFIDLFLFPNKLSRNVACGFFIVARKPLSSIPTT